MTERIETLVGRRVWDSRGKPTVEAEVHLTDGSFGRAIAPAGASRGSYEAVDLETAGTLSVGMGSIRRSEHWLRLSRQQSLGCPLTIRGSSTDV